VDKSAGLSSLLSDGKLMRPRGVVCVQRNGAENAFAAAGPSDYCPPEGGKNSRYVRTNIRTIWLRRLRLEDEWRLQVDPTSGRC
jgi:hypothetical protein